MLKFLGFLVVLWYWLLISSPNCGLIYLGWCLNLLRIACFVSSIKNFCWWSKIQCDFGLFSYDSFPFNKLWDNSLRRSNFLMFKSIRNGFGWSFISSISKSSFWFACLKEKRVKLHTYVIQCNFNKITNNDFIYLDLHWMISLNHVEWK